MNPFNRHGRLRENLSAYIDGELRADEARVVARHLETCAACRAEIDDLRVASGALGQLPAAEPSRSFSLTPNMVAAPRPTPQRRPSPVLQTGMRLAAAGLAVALAAVMIVDRADFGGSDGGSRDSAALQKNQALAPAGATDNAFSIPPPLAGQSDRAGVASPEATTVPGDSISGTGGSVGGAATSGTPAPAAAGGMNATGGALEQKSAETSPAPNVVAAPGRTDSAQNAAPAASAAENGSSGPTALELIEGLLAVLLGAAIGALVVVWFARRWTPV